ncbi:MAG: recombinase RecT [Oscillospiraceae bacterium]
MANNSLVKNNNQVQQGGITSYLKAPAVEGYLQQVLGSRKEKFVTNMVALVNANPALAECTNKSLMSAAIIATSLDLSLNSSFGHAYVVPFKNNKTGNKDAQFQIGWKGYVQLAIRSGQYKKINAVPIYANQFISWNMVEEEIVLSDDLEESGEVVGYLAYIETINGFKKTMYWTKTKMLKHADTFSMAFNVDNYKKKNEGTYPQKDLWKLSSFWYKDFDSMAQKTMLRQILSKYGILSIEMQQAYENDQAVIDVQENKKEYIDNDITQSILEEAVQVQEEVKTNQVVDQETGEITQQVVDEMPM